MNRFFRHSVKNALLALVCAFLLLLLPSLALGVEVTADGTTPTQTSGITSTLGVMLLSSGSGAHKHCVCGGGVAGHSHAQVEWTAWNGTDAIEYTGGEAHVYLTGDAQRGTSLSVPDENTLYLCLNGHVLSAKIGGAIKVQGKLFVCDCNSAVVHKFAKDDEDGAWKLDPNGDITVLGGIICFGGASGSGSGVRVGQDSDDVAEFTLYGGSIIGGSANAGGGVYIDEKGTFTMLGGKIAGCVSVGSDVNGGGGVYAGGKFNFLGGSIVNNAATGGADGGGVYVAQTGTMTLSGAAYALGNKKQSTTNNIYLPTGKTISVTGELTGGTGGVGITTQTQPTGTVPVNVAVDNRTNPQAALLASKLSSDVARFRAETFSDGTSSYIRFTFAHNHCVCGGRVGGHTHASHDWTPYSGGEIKYTNDAAYIYLSSDVTLDDTIVVPAYKTLCVCLNGNDIIAPDGKTAIKADSSATLNLCDCNSVAPGKITHAAGQTGSAVHAAGGTFNFYSGCISGNTSANGALDVDSTANMYGGSVKDNAAASSSYGAGVCVDGTFNLYGGEICANTNAYDGGGVYVALTGRLNMPAASTAVISGNAARSGGGVYAAGTLDLQGGQITRNKATSGGGGMYVASGAKATLSGTFSADYNTDAATPAKESNILLNGGVKLVLSPTYSGFVRVSASPSPTEEKPVVIATGANAANELCVFSDDAHYAATFDEAAGTISLGSGHMHCVCGSDTCTGTGHNPRQKWTGWDGKSAIAYSASGEAFVYLKGEGATTALTADLTVPAGKVLHLCLNGKTLDTGAYKIIDNGILTLCDCDEETSYGIWNADHTVYTISDAHPVLPGAVYDTLTGGRITKSSDSNTNPAIEVSSNSVFTMYCGNIAGAKSGDDGAVHVNSNGQFAMYGGSIVGNHAKGGVHAEDNATIYLGGTPVITNNYSAVNETRNLVLHANARISYTAALTGAARIGVSSFGINNESSVTDISVPSQHANGTEENYIPDDAGQYVRETGTGAACKLQLFKGYVVAYGSGGATEGDAPVDNEKYSVGDTVILPGQGNLKKGVNAFVGWSAGGKTYAPGAGFVITKDTGLTTTFTAVWKLNNVYISGTGDDANDGGTMDKPVKTFAKAKELVKPDGRILVCGTIPVNTEFTLDPACPVIGRYESFHGYMFVVGAGGTLNIGAGTVIEGNASGENDSVIQVIESGTVNLSGGEIRNNTSRIYGGAIYVNKGTLNMSGGKITGCTASDGGAVYLNDGTFSMTGGEISGNTASAFGGGVYVSNTGSVAMSGGMVTQNTAPAQSGGGVYLGNSAVMSVCGGAQVYDNSQTDDGVYDDIFMGSGTQKPIIVTGALTDAAILGVRYIGLNEPIAVGKSHYDEQGDFKIDYQITEADADKFYSDDPAKDTELKADAKGLNGVYLNDDHKHCLCGSKRCKGAGHEQILFNSVLNDIGSLVLPGNYVLTKDLTTEFPMRISGSEPGVVNICLNGYNIIAPANKPAFIVEAGATLNICDCTTQGKIIGSAGDYALTVGGDATLYNGSISGGEGGGVYVSGTFAMKDGSVEGNKRFGGVAGVCADGRTGVIALSGGAVIQNNIESNLGGDVSSNIYLPAGRTITLTAALDEDAKLFITSADKTETNRVPVAAGSAMAGAYTPTADDAARMLSDIAGYRLRFNSQTGCVDLFTPYKIVYDKNGGEGTLPADGNVYADEDVAHISRDTGLTKQGFAHAGFALLPDAEEAFDTYTIYPQNANAQNEIVFYAVWVPKGNTVTLDKQGGTDGTDSVNAVRGREMPPIELPKLPGYTFSGYFAEKITDTLSVPRQYYNADGTSAQAWDGDADATIFAWWEPNIYSVQFMANGGAGEMQAQGFTYDVEQNLSENTFTKKYCVFDGWNTKADGTGTAYKQSASVKNLSTEPDGYVELFAMWKDSKLDVPKNAVWGTGFEESVAKWDAVDKATAYDLLLYKNNSPTPVETVTGVTALAEVAPSHDFTDAMKKHGSGSYTFTVRATAGDAHAPSDYTKPSAALVYQAPPIIEKEPADFTTLETGRGEFYVQAKTDNRVPIIYQWQRQEKGSEVWRNIEGANSHGYFVMNSDIAKDDGAKFRCVMGAGVMEQAEFDAAISDLANLGRLSSITVTRAAKLTVLPKHTIRFEPVAPRITAGQSVNIKAIVEGVPQGFDLSFSWEDESVANPRTVSPTQTTTYTATAYEVKRGVKVTASITVVVEPARYELVAKIDGTNLPYDDFGAKTHGYAQSPAAKLVTVTNTGNQTLTIPVPTHNDYAIALISSPASQVTLAPQGTAQFTVQPKTGLNVGSHPGDIAFVAEESADAADAVYFDFAVNAAPMAGISGQMTYIRNAPAGLLTATVTGGTAPFTYTWDNGIPGVDPSTVAVSTAQTDTYKVTVTDACGITCTAEATVTIVDPSYSISMDKHALDFGTGAVGGSLPLTQTATLKNTGTSAVTITLPTDGHFDITATPTDLATSTDLVLAPNETASISVRPKAECNDTAGIYKAELEFAVQGESGVYSTLWTKYIVGTSELPDAYAYVSGDSTMRAFAEAELVANAIFKGDVDTYQWQEKISDVWQNVTAGEISGNTIRFKNEYNKQLTPGTHKFRAVVTGNDSHELAPEFTITVLEDKNSLVANPSSLDFGIQRTTQPVTLTNTGTGTLSIFGCSYAGNKLFDVVFPADFKLEPGQSGTINITPLDNLAEGVYQQTIKIVSTECNAVIIASYTVPPAPAVRITCDPADGKIIATETARLTARASGGSTGGYTYLWSNGETTSEIAVSPTTDTTYTVTVTDAVGKQGTASFTVKVAPAEYKLSISPASADFGRASFGYSTPPERVITVMNLGNAKTTLTLSALSQFNVAVQSGALADIAPGAYVTLAVSPKEKLIIGKHSETLAITGTGDASASSALAFEVVPPPTVTIDGNTQLKVGETGTLTARASGGFAPYGYLWVKNLAVCGITDTLTFEHAIAGSYLYELMVEDATGGAATATVTVNVTAAAPHISASPGSFALSAYFGYTATPSATVTVKNTGDIAVMLVNPAPSDVFEFSALTPGTLLPGENATMTVTPKLGLPIGNYNEEIVIGTLFDGATAKVNAAFTVSSAPVPPRPDPDPEPTPDPTPVPVPTPMPTLAPSPSASAQPSARPTAKPTAKPTARPSATPTASHSPSATPFPTLDPNITPDELIENSGYIDAAFTDRDITREEAAYIDKLYQQMWEERDPAHTYLLDVYTGTFAKLENRIYGEVDLAVTYPASGADYDEAVSMAGDGEVIVMFDVSLLQNGVAIQPDGNVELTLSFKEHVGQDITLAHRRADGEWETFRVTVGEDSFVTIRTSSLSPFVAYIPRASAPATPGAEPTVKPTMPQDNASGGAQNGVPLWVWIAAAAAVVAIAVIIIIIRKRKETK